MIKPGVLERPGCVCWTLREISDVLKLPVASTRVFCTRKVAQGQLLRIRRDLYVLPSAFARFSEKELFLAANVAQTPSYVSFLTALSYHNLTTQIPSGRIESANPVRSISYSVESVVFRYFFCSPGYYFGYIRKDGFFIAQPEKALVDALYLVSLGRYAVDRAALERRQIDRLNWAQIRKWLKKYPLRFRKFCDRWRDA